MSGGQSAPAGRLVAGGDYPAPNGIELPTAQSPDGAYDFVRYRTDSTDYYGIADRVSGIWHWLERRGFIQSIGWVSQ